MILKNGEPSVKDGLTLCSSCHKRVHDEGWRVTRLADGASVTRHPDAQALLLDADERTRSITQKLDKRRAVFQFERPNVGETVPDVINGDTELSTTVDDRAEFEQVRSARDAESGFDVARQSAVTATDCCAEPPAVYRVTRRDTRPLVNGRIRSRDWLEFLGQPEYFIRTSCRHARAFMTLPRGSARHCVITSATVKGADRNER